MQMTGRYAKAGWLLMAAVTLLARPGMAEEALSAQQIADRVMERNAFGFENAVARMTLVLVSKSGGERERKIEIRSVERAKLNRSLVRFHAPAEVAGTSFLVLENAGADDDQYLYLPALGKVKRITGGQRSQKFMGTDLTYADLESRNLEDAHLSRLPDADVGGQASYVLEARPKNPTDSQYSKTISWVHKSSFVPLKVQFFDKKGALLKTLTVHRLEKKDGRMLATSTTVEDVQGGTKTKMRLDGIDFNAKLDDSEFTERALAGG